jgi:hypothetical protein
MPLTGLCARLTAGVPLAEFAAVPALLLLLPLFLAAAPGVPPSRTLRASLSLPLPAPPRTESVVVPFGTATALALDRFLAAPDSVPDAPDASGDAAVLRGRDAASLGFLRAASLPLASEASGEPGRLAPASPAAAPFLRPDGVFSPRVVCPERGSLRALSPDFCELSESASESRSSLWCGVSLVENK